MSISINPVNDIHEIEMPLSYNNITHFNLQVDYTRKLVNKLKSRTLQNKVKCENKKPDVNVKINKTITITFGEQAENHKGMQIIGKHINQGYTCSDLENMKNRLSEQGLKVMLYNLSENLDENIRDKNDAKLLIVKNGVEFILSKDEKFRKENLLNELLKLNYDKQAFMYGRVVNKHARHNLCFSDFEQTADIQNKKGTIVNFNKVPVLNYIRENLPKYFGEKSTNLQGEANFYYDTNKCGIGFHGDSERKIVLGIRLGDSIPLVYQWFYKNEKVGNQIVFDNIENGDIYLMSEKATGNDWKKKNIYTLRHAAGCKKFTN